MLTAEDLERLGGFARYKDVDGDGVGYRTLPGTNHPQRGLLHARQRPQRKGAVHRARRRLREQHGPAGAQIRNHARARSAAGGRIQREARRSASWRSARRTTPWRRAGISCNPNTASRPAIMRLRAYPFNAGADGLHPPARARVRGGSEPRRADAGADAAGVRRRTRSPSCEACGTTAACRSMRALSPTTSVGQEGGI